MRSVQLSALTVLALGALAPSAFTAQTFTFANPFASGGSSFANSQFETFGVSPGGNDPTASIESFYTGTVGLVVVGGTTAGAYTATYQLLDSSGGTVIDGSINPSGTETTTEGGTLTFSSPVAIPSLGVAAGGTLLAYTFTSGGIFSLGGFGVSPSSNSQVTSVTGPLVDLTGGPVNNALSKFSFSFPGFFVDPISTTGALHYTAGFTSRIEVVPEPASMGVLAIGAVALLRRRRRA